MGLKPADVRVRFNHRRVLADLLGRLGVDDEHLSAAFVLLDRRERCRTTIWRRWRLSSG